MRIYVLKKLKNRKYDSQDLLSKVLFEEGLQGCAVNRKSNDQLYIDSTCAGMMLHVSVSHTKNYWVCALCEISAVGIDIEEDSRDINKGIVRMLHPLEREYLCSFPVDSREWKREFLNVWTRKESCVKFLGTGLSEGLSTFSVISQTGELCEIVHNKSGDMMAVSSIYVADGLTASVCSADASTSTTVIPLKFSGLPFKTALEQASNILAVRDYSLNGLINKLLEKGHSKEDAKSAALELQERGYVDDVHYAQRFVEQAVAKGKATYRIKRELIEKGIEENLTQEILSKTIKQEGSSESDRAYIQAKRLLGISDEPQDLEEGDEVPVPTVKQLQKVGRQLSALGYDSSIIYEIIDRLRR